MLCFFGSYFRFSPLSFWAALRKLRGDSKKDIGFNRGYKVHSIVEGVFNRMLLLNIREFDWLSRIGIAAQIKNLDYK